MAHLMAVHAPDAGRRSNRQPGADRLATLRRCRLTSQRRTEWRPTATYARACDRRPAGRRVHAAPANTCLRPIGSILSRKEPSDKPGAIHSLDADFVSPTAAASCERVRECSSHAVQRRQQMAVEHQSRTRAERRSSRGRMPPRCVRGGGRQSRRMMSRHGFQPCRTPDRARRRRDEEPLRVPGLRRPRGRSAVPPRPTVRRNLVPEGPRPRQRRCSRR
jgi:hypothetical protein